jgi:hypothetical protein
MVHPKVQEIYNRNNIEYIKTAADRYEEIFEARTRNQEKKIIIDAVYRSKKGSFKTQEYVYWYQTTVSHDYRGNEIKLPQIIGRYDEPIPLFVYDEKTNTTREQGIQGHKTVYEYPFSKDLLLQMYEDDKITGNTKFYIESTSRTYSIDDWDDFIEKDFNYLLHLGKTGFRPGKETSAEIVSQTVKRRSE